MLTRERANGVRAMVTLAWQHPMLSPRKAEQEPSEWPALDGEGRDSPVDSMRVGRSAMDLRRAPEWVPV